MKVEQTQYLFMKAEETLCLFYEGGTDTVFLLWRWNRHSFYSMKVEGTQCFFYESGTDTVYLL
jgi:hypothetical protein